MKNQSCLFFIAIVFAFIAGCDERRSITEYSSEKEATDQVVEFSGRQVYLTYGCAVCHGENADGRGVASARLDPKPIDFRNRKAYRYGSDKERIKMLIKSGSVNGGSPMPAFKHIPDQELDQLADYLLSLQNID